MKNRYNRAPPDAIFLISEFVGGAVHLVSKDHFCLEAIASEACIVDVEYEHYLDSEVRGR